MKQIILWSLLTIFSFTACSIKSEIASAEPHKTNNSRSNIEDSPVKNKKLVLVELFTSEGCSSCPPADRALSKLQGEQPVENVEIVTLGYHIDYWDYLGWKDEFSSTEYSKRQNDYANAFNLRSNYTPQMIVDGSAQFTGSNWSNALTEIGNATENHKGIVNISAEQNDSETNLDIKITGLKLNEDANVYLAVAENNLMSNVKRGENNGKKLSHISVVRNLSQIGTINSVDKNYETQNSVELKDIWKKKDLKYVVFVQNNRSKKIVAVGQTN